MTIAPAGLTGSSGALRVWGDILSRLDARQAMNRETVEPPEGIEFTGIDRRTGLQIDADCSHAVTLPFVIGTMPEGHSFCD